MKLFRVVSYVLDLEGMGHDSIVEQMENCKYISLHVREVRQADIGEWSDDHECNKRGCDYSKFFSEQKD